MTDVCRAQFSVSSPAVAVIPTASSEPGSQQYFMHTFSFISNQVSGLIFIVWETAAFNFLWSEDDLELPILLLQLTECWGYRRLVS